jgi:3-oxoacyl-[acyl-carrier protein] reductase
MDLGIKGRRAIVCASSKGLGLACARQLAREGVDLVMIARGQEALEAAAQNIRDESGVKVTTVAADITTSEGRAKVLAVCPDPDILVTNAGGPKPGDFREWSREDWISAVDANMLTPIEMIRATVDKMIERKFGRIVNITSASVKMPIEILGLSNGARAGLTGFVSGLARQTVAHNVTINNLLPGPFATDRLLQTAERLARDSGKNIEQVMTARKAAVPAGRFGEPDEFGQACAFLCGAKSGFISGQNLVMDGGIYPGTL